MTFVDHWICTRRLKTYSQHEAKKRSCSVRVWVSTEVLSSASASTWRPNVVSCAYSANILLRPNVKIILGPNLRLWPFYAIIFVKFHERDRNSSLFGMPYRSSEFEVEMLEKASCTRSHSCKLCVAPNSRTVTSFPSIRKIWSQSPYHSLRKRFFTVALPVNVQNDPVYVPTMTKKRELSD